MNKFIIVIMIMLTIIKYSVSVIIYKMYSYHCEKYRNFTQFPVAEILCGSCTFSQIFHTRKLGETTVFFAAYIFVSQLTLESEDWNSRNIAKYFANNKLLSSRQYLLLTLCYDSVRSWKIRFVLSRKVLFHCWRLLQFTSPSSK